MLVQFRKLKVNQVDEKILNLSLSQMIRFIILKTRISFSLLKLNLYFAGIKQQHIRLFKSTSGVAPTIRLYQT